jgi:hypothetical protein
MRIRILAVSAVLGTLAALVATVPAQADDHGDNQAACNMGEICFSAQSHFNDSVYRRDFYWDDWDHGNDYYSAYPGQTPVMLADHALSFWNRDTECYVGLWDLDASGYFNLYYLAAPASSPAWPGTINNAHGRCPIF